MSVIDNSLLLTAPAGSSSYQVSRSLRFSSPDSSYLNRTPASAGNRTTWTWAGWVKRSTLSTSQYLFSASDWATTTTAAFFYLDTLVFYDYQSGAYSTRLDSSQVFRDAAAWQHLVFTWDSTNATSTDRMRIYVNGARVTAFSSTTYPSSGVQTRWNNNLLHRIGTGNVSDTFDGYLADIHFIDGQALDPSSFTTTDLTTGQLIPKAYTGGSYGTNGFKLNFSDNSTTAALGTDTSGNGNTFSVNNLTAAEYRVIDAPSLSNGAMIARGASGGSVTVTISGTGTKNYFTSTNGIDWTWQSGAASATYTANYIAAGGAGTNSRIAVSAGVFQYAMWNTNTNFDSGSNTTADTTGLTFTTTTNNGANGDSLVDTPTSYGTDTGVGGEVRGNYCTWNPLKKTSDSLSTTRIITNGNLDLTVRNLIILGTIGVSSGKWYWEITANSSGTAASIIPGIARDNVDVDKAYPRYVGGDPNSWGYDGYNGNKYNNSSSTAYGSTFTSGDVIGIALDLDNGKIFFSKNNTWQNSGSPTSGTNPAFSGLTSGPYFPAFSDGGGGSDSSIIANFGQRAFAYTVPTGFKALVDTNLPTPVVAKPNTLMDVVAYTGTGASRSITGLNFSPDFVWIKERGAAGGHNSYDTVRGASVYLASESTSAEGTDTDALTAFNSNGFSLGSGYSVKSANGSGRSYVAWAWDAGTSTVTNTAGSITASLRANTSSGFSVVSFTGTGSGATVGHGLGVAPAMIIVKNRSSATDWAVGHTSAGWSVAGNLNNTNSFGASSYFNSTAPTSTVFSVGASSVSNGSGNSIIAYCFTPVSGYSSMGSFLGNGSSNGVFVYTGMRPRFLLTKRTDSAESWIIHDTARNQYNVADLRLRPNSSDAEATVTTVDILSNGFKLRTGGAGEGNDNGATYIFAAFAESPFQYARAR